MTLLAAISREASTAYTDFAESVMWTPAGGSATQVEGIFDRLSEVTDIGEMIQMDGVAAMLDIDDASVPGVALGDVVVARTITYRVVGVEPTGTGRTKLVLGI